jgi:hypothetical protein
MYKIVNHVCAFDIAYSCGHKEVIHWLGYVCYSILVFLLYALSYLILIRRKL